MRVQVLVRLKPGVLDVQGKAVEQGLKRLGFEGVGSVRVGRVVEFDLPTGDLAAVKGQIEDMCGKLLANPIIENFEVKKAE